MQISGGLDGMTAKNAIGRHGTGTQIRAPERGAFAMPNMPVSALLDERDRVLFRALQASVLAADSWCRYKPKPWHQCRSQRGRAAWQATRSMTPVPRDRARGPRVGSCVR